MALDHFTYTRPTTTDVIDATGNTVTVAVDVPPFEFNSDGTYKGLKWTDDSQATKEDASDLIGQTEGRIIFEVNQPGGLIQVVNVGAVAEAGIVKVEFRYTPTTQKLFFNDTEVASATGNYDWSGMNKIEIGHDDGSDQPTDVHYRLLSIYKTANS